MKRRVLSVMWAGSLLMGIPALAQLTPTAPVVEVLVKPSTIIPGMRVEVSGTTTHDGKNLDVAISIASNSAAGVPALSIKTRADAGGHYSAVTSPLATAGRYTVNVVTNGGKGRASATLEVQSPDGIDERMGQSAGASLDLAMQSLTEIEQDLAALPPGAETSQLKAKLDGIEAAVTGARPKFAEFTHGLQNLNQVSNRYPATQAALLDVYEASNLAAAEIERQRATTAGQLRRSRRAGDRCEMLDSVNERLNFLNAFINTIGLQFDSITKASEVSKNWLFNSVPRGVDALGDRSPLAGLTPDQKFAATEALKALAPRLLGPISFVSTVTGLLLDATQYLLSKEYAKYCERFEGPIKSEFGITFFDKGHPYWTYRMTLKGKIGMRYAKGSAGSPAVVRGQIEGTATHFDIREDLRVLQPEVAPYVLFRKVIPPVPMPWVEDLGAYPRQLTSPSYFKIPLEGTITGDKIVFHLASAATSDFTPVVRGKAIYVLLTPGPLPLPQTFGFDLPVKDAYFILSRSLHATNTLNVVTAGESLETKQTFTRDAEGSQHDYKVSIKTDVKACNPGCAASLSW